LWVKFAWNGASGKFVPNVNVYQEASAYGIMMAAPSTHSMCSEILHRAVPFCLQSSPVDQFHG
jgi:hypothetical protein